MFGAKSEAVTPLKTIDEPVQGRRVLYGAPLEVAAMAHAPTNELGVIFLFGALAAFGGG